MINKELQWIYKIALRYHHRFKLIEVAKSSVIISDGGYQWVYGNISHYRIVVRLGDNQYISTNKRNND